MNAMIPIPNFPRALARAFLTALGPLLAAQAAGSPLPIVALETLAAKDCQPNPDAGIPPRARAALEHFKDHLGPWIQKQLTSLPDGSTAELGQRLSQSLESLAAQAPKPEDSFWHPLRFQVETPEAHSELIAVTARFGIDATLLLFRRGEGGWKLLWQDRAPAFDDIDGAFGSYTTAFTPKGTDGAFFLAAARITPWYQSHWQTAELRVFRIDPDGQARKIGAREEGVFLGVEDPMSLKAQDAQHIVLRLRAASNDPVRHTFSRVFHLSLDPGGLHRVPPYAETPLDLADEWLSLPWPEAAALNDSASLKRLKPLHARLSDHEEDLLNFDEKATLDQASGLWELRAELERDEKVEDYVFRIGKTEGELRVLDVLRQHKP